MTANQAFVGVGGWTFAPWRDNFYPKGLPQARELEYAGQQLTAIEINATFYSLQKRDSWIKWARATPDGFRFTVKASRFCTNRKVLADAGESIGRFVAQGFAELGPKLGPIVWQFSDGKRFEPDDFAAFLGLLPRETEGVPLRHALEVRHESFACTAFVQLARDHGCAIAIADHETRPMIADLTAPFVYARLQRSEAGQPTGYDPTGLDRWASVVRGWTAGEAPPGLRYVSDVAAEPIARDAFVFFISGAKERNPAAAQALIERLR